MRLVFLSSMLVCACTSSLWSAVGEHAGSKYLVRASLCLWNPTLGGAFDFNDPSSTYDTDISASDLSLDNANTTLKYEVGINLPLVFDLTVGGFGYSDHTRKALSSDKSFGEADFGSGTDVKSNLSVDDVYVEFGFRLLNTDMAGAWVGLAIHAQQVHNELSAGAESDVIDKDMYFPTLTARAFVNLPKELTLEGKIHYLSFDFGDYKGNYLELHAQVTWRPLHNLGILAGWQVVDADFDLDNIGNSDAVKYAYDLSGPYIGVIAQF